MVSRRRCAPFLQRILRDRHRPARFLPLITDPASDFHKTCSIIQTEATYKTLTNINFAKTEPKHLKLLRIKPPIRICENNVQAACTFHVEQNQNQETQTTSRLCTHEHKHIHIHIRY